MRRSREEPMPVAGPRTARPRFSARRVRKRRAASIAGRDNDSAVDRRRAGGSRRASPRHRLEGRVLGRERRARARALLDRRHRRDGRQAVVGGLDRLGAASASCRPSSTPRSPGCSPTRSGGASVYGAAAWVRYSRFIAPLSVWCNWLAWTPVLAIGSGLAAGYMLNALLPGRCGDPHLGADARSTSAALKDGLTLRIDATVRHRRGDPAAASSPPSTAGSCAPRSVQTSRHRGAACRCSSSASCRCSPATCLPANFFPFAPSRSTTPAPTPATGRGTSTAGRCSSAGFSSPPGRPTRSRPRSATPRSSSNPGDRHLQGDPLLGPALHRASSRWCRSSFQGALGVDGHAGAGRRRRLGGRGGHGEHGRRRRRSSTGCWSSC